MSALFAAIVDWKALGEVVAYSFAAALLLTAVFTTGVLAVDTDRVTVARRAAAVASFAVCAGLVAFGLYVMFSSK